MLDHLNIKKLKTELIDIPVKFCEKASRKKYKNTKIPQSYIDDLKLLCSQYNIKLKIFKTKRENSYCDYGYYDNDNYAIIRLRIDKDDPIITIEDICTRFTHELAHHIQSIVRLKNKQIDKYFTMSFKDILKYELTADRFAYFIYKHHFKHLGKFTHRNFNAYRNKRDIEWLKKFIKLDKNKDCI